MNKPLKAIETALVPIGLGTEGDQALALAKCIASEVILVGVVPIAEESRLARVHKWQERSANV